MWGLFRRDVFKIQRMKNKVSIEQVFLIILSTVLLCSCGAALLIGYSISWDFYLAGAGLVILTLISITSHKFLLPGLLILLILGSFHLVSFLYFFNIFFGISFGKVGTPKLQLFSLVLLIILVLLKKKSISSFLKSFSASSENKNEEDSKHLRNQYIKKFENLSDLEIEKRLSKKLIPEAREALVEILNSRNKI